MCLLSAQFEGSEEGRSPCGGDILFNYGPGTQYPRLLASEQGKTGGGTSAILPLFEHVSVRIGGAKQCCSRPIKEQFGQKRGH